ncbi:membrane protein [Porphyromonas macacae]|uniref:Membrane protein n=1 Tax=Porphyromonas macacae TaxID=28115 RepID=A0A0A2GDP3_9PORP|nr:YitT family protein [Porphyromonas macacae]KGN74410.1 membrane protein [Porphyromonas macacae]KGO00588.1 membrane protein [Porphyromonas macacae]SUB77692.1 Uncharacterized BCR, YitT family COG1284 [Porphyromonas macacae]
MTPTISAPKNRAQKAKYLAHDMFFILLGIACYAFGWTGFILSQRITTGGLAGISTIIHIITGQPAYISYNIINVFLLIIALIFLGWKFSLKTVIGVLLIAPMVTIGESLFGNQPMLADQPFMALLIGSVFCGLGLGLVFGVNGSTGGTDVIVAIINKYKNISLGRAMIMVDLCIIISSYFVNVYFAKETISSAKAIDLLVYSAVEVLLVSLTMDWYVNSNRQSVQFWIFSTKYEEINEAIIKRLGRGCTMLHAEGGYSHQPAKVLVVVVRKRNSLPVYRIIQEIDPKAFVSQGAVRGVYGEGFDQISKSK